MKNIIFNNTELSLSLTKRNGQNHIQAIDIEDGCPYMTITKQIPHDSLGDNDVIIKNYSENKGILEALIDQDVIEPPHGKIASGYVTLDVCRLKID